MLYEMLEEITGQIEALDWEEAAPIYADQLLIQRPDLPRRLFEKPGEEHVRWAAEQLAYGHLSLIKDIPRYVSTLLAAVEDPHMEPSYKAAIVGSLAYLVQPRDLIPDDLPGAFGLLDDCLLLHVTTSECVAYLPRDFSTHTRELLTVCFLGLAIPEQRHEQFLEAADGVRELIFSMGLVDDDEVVRIATAIVDNPLAPLPAADPDALRGSRFPDAPPYFAPPRARGVNPGGEIFFYFEDGTALVKGGEVQIIVI